MSLYTILLAEYYCSYQEATLNLTEPTVVNWKASPGAPQTVFQKIFWTELCHFLRPKLFPTPSHRRNSPARSPWRIGRLCRSPSGTWHWRYPWSEMHPGLLGTRQQQWHSWAEIANVLTQPRWVHELHEGPISTHSNPLHPQNFQWKSSLKKSPKTL